MTTAHLLLHDLDADRTASNVLEALDDEAFGLDAIENWSVYSVSVKEAQDAALAAVTVESRDCKVTWSPEPQ